MSEVYRVTVAITSTADVCVDAIGVSEEQAVEAALAEAWHRWQSLQWVPVQDDDGEPAISVIAIDRMSREEAERLMEHPEPLTLADLAGADEGEEGSDA
jgi:flavin-binding protein dodecin